MTGHIRWCKSPGHLHDKGKLWKATSSRRDIICFCLSCPSEERRDSAHSNKWQPLPTATSRHIWLDVLFLTKWCLFPNWIFLLPGIFVPPADPWGLTDLFPTPPMSHTSSRHGQAWIAHAGTHQYPAHSFISNESMKALEISKQPLLSQSLPFQPHTPNWTTTS